jgi:hypothetical protein
LRLAQDDKKKSNYCIKIFDDELSNFGREISLMINEKIAKEFFLHKN